MPERETLTLSTCQGRKPLAQDITDRRSAQATAEIIDDITRPVNNAGSAARSGLINEDLDNIDLELL